MAATRVRRRGQTGKKRKTMRRRRVRRQRGGGEAKQVVFKLTNNAGFGSTFGFFLQSYIYAKKNGFVFKVKNEGWQYGPEKGWHEFFTTLEDYNPSDTTPIDREFGHGSGPTNKYTLGDYHNAINEVYKPVQEILTKADEFIKSIGGPFKAIYVRRGDKVAGTGKEMDAADVGKVVKDAGITDGNLFVMTDDYTVVDEVKKLLPAVRVFSLTNPASKGFSIFKSREADVETKKREAAELFTSIEVFHKAEKGWVDNRSNMGRFLKMRGLDKIVLYPSSGTLSLDSIVDPPYNPF